MDIDFLNCILFSTAGKENEAGDCTLWLYLPLGVVERGGATQEAQGDAQRGQRAQHLHKSNVVMYNYAYI